MPCNHITNCNECKEQVCSYCVDDCSGCQLEWCKECYLRHQEGCMECLAMLCPDEIEMLEAEGEDPNDLVVIQICPRCNIQNDTSLQTSS